MNITLTNFESRNRDIFDLILVPENFDVGGGKITKKEIDVIKRYPDAKSIQVSGLNQETFEYLISNYGCQFEAISFLKNKTVSDLSLLSNLRQLKYVYYFYNQRATELWDMKKNVNLIGLAIYDFSKLHKIDAVATAPNLKKFSIGNEVWAKCQIESVKPLINSTITHFAWWGDKVLDNDFQCLSQSNICELDLNVSAFKMEELAQLVASIPNLTGKATKPYREQGIIKDDGTKILYYYPCKGKKTMIKGKDDVRLEMYISEFERLVEMYQK